MPFALLALRRVENTLLQLLNDMRTVVEARCVRHGVGGGTTANSAAALLPMIGIEIIAQRTRTGNESRDDATKRVFGEIANLTGYPAYATVGFPLFKLCRNGLAHGFYPNDVQSANGPKGAISIRFWIDGVSKRSVCVNDMAGRVESDHLVVDGGSDVRLLVVIGQHLYLDVKSYIEGFLARLETDTALQAVVAANDDGLLAEANEGALDTLGNAGLTALGI